MPSPSNYDWQKPSNLSGSHWHYGDGKESSVSPSQGYGGLVSGTLNPLHRWRRGAKATGHGESVIGERKGGDSWFWEAVWQLTKSDLSSGTREQTAVH